MHLVELQDYTGARTMRVNAGRGDNRFQASSAAEIIDGGEGIDTVDYRASTSGVEMYMHEDGHVKWSHLLGQFCSFAKVYQV